MRLFVYVVWLAFFVGCNNPQPKSIQKKPKEARTNPFVTKVYNLNNLKDRREFEKWEQKNLDDNKGTNNEILYHEDTVNVKGLGFLRFEDEKFKVFSNCKGEWGGSLIFLDKKTQKRYKVSSDCPLMIENQAGQYLIASTLAHISGSLTVKTISDPRKSSERNNPSFLYSGDRITGSLLFRHQSKLFLIYSDLERTFLGQIQNQKLIQIDTLLPFPIYVKEGKMNKVINGIYTSELLNQSLSQRTHKDHWVNINTEGKIYAKGDTILLGYKYKKTLTKEYPE